MAAAGSPARTLSGRPPNPSSTDSSSVSASERGAIRNDAVEAPAANDTVLFDDRSSAAKSAGSVCGPGRTVTGTATSPAAAGNSRNVTVAVSVSSRATYDDAPKETVRGDGGIPTVLAAGSLRPSALTARTSIR